MGRKPKAPEGESIDELEARLAELKKAAASQREKRSRGRPRGSKNKPKTLEPDAEGDEQIDTSTDTSVKQPKT